MPQRSSNRTQPTSTTGPGLLLGTTALLGGAIWCYKHHIHNRHQPHTGRLLPDASGTTRPSNSWLLGALGAGLAGAALGASGLTKHRGTGHQRYSDDVHLTGQVTIRRPPEEVYEYWKNFRNLSAVMSFVERVEPREGNITHWVAKVPAGPSITWDAEIVDDKPGRLLAWRALEGSDLQTWGTVMFDPGDNNLSTDVSVAFNFSPPANVSGTMAQYLSGLENTLLDKNLRDLKSRLEGG